jgi:preprotein translocase subunit SecD
VEIVEERTVGPSLGQENIEQGVVSIKVGFLLVVLFMAGYYRSFGLIADFALLFNLVLLTAILSLLQATLTLPGMAGIVLTLGMAVDANVLINERIREEVRNGQNPQSAIYIGYEKAFATILDANMTHLIVAILLLTLGSGPVKGFAIVLTFGIATSIFTSIAGSRMLVNWLYGGDRRIEKLSV